MSSKEDARAARPTSRLTRGKTAEPARGPIENAVANDPLGPKPPEADTVDASARQVLEFFARREAERGSLVEIDNALAAAEKALRTKTPFVWRNARGLWLAYIEPDRQHLLEVLRTHPKGQPLPTEISMICHRLTDFCDKVCAIDDALDSQTRRKLIVALCREKAWPLDRSNIAKRVAHELGIALRTVQRDLADIRDADTDE